MEVIFVICCVLQSRSLYVKNLNFKTSDGSVKKHFEEHMKGGKILSVRVYIVFCRLLDYECLLQSPSTVFYVFTLNIGENACKEREDCVDGIWFHRV